MIKGICIGILFGIPVGAVGAMTVQRTFNYGVKAGLLTGLGASAADCLYACISVFGLTFLSDILLRYQSIIQFAGGCLILGMGIHMFLTKKAVKQNKPGPAGAMRMFMSSFAVGVTNPAAILTFLFAFSLFDIHGKGSLAEGANIVLGVFLGTFVWWWLLSMAVVLLKRKTGNKQFFVMNRVFGVILVVFGAVIFLDSVFCF